MSTPFDPFVQKMEAAGVSPAAIHSFRRSYDILCSGEAGQIPETRITPVTQLPELPNTRPSPDRARNLVPQTVVLKLNGGLGTSMGLDKAKTLLPVKNGRNFLDLIALQILHLCERYDSPVSFLLMDSFSTTEDTQAYLTTYPQLGTPAAWELLQNMAPKILATDRSPAVWPANPKLEWCPPGHGDLYAAIQGSGWLDRLLAAGKRYLFVSNADNLGATLDLALLDFFASSGSPFLMEVTPRTAADRKGGHLCRDAATGALRLREIAQCPEADLGSFQDIERHGFFNTNNLWIDLVALQHTLKEHGGSLPLPVIINRKTLDPKNKHSPAVYQLETAMGAAIEVFPNAGAIVVPRSRFAPVKTTSDLLVLRSDAYSLTENSELRLHPLREGEVPLVELDQDHYKLIHQLEEALGEGVPSLLECSRLIVQGPVRFASGVVIRRDVTLRNPASEPATVPAGVYRDMVWIAA